VAEKPDNERDSKVVETPPIRFPESVLAPPVWVRRAILAMTITAVVVIGVMFVAIWPYQNFVAGFIYEIRWRLSALPSQGLEELRLSVSPEVIWACFALLIALYGVVRLHITSSLPGKAHCLNVVAWGVTGALILISVDSVIGVMDSMNRIFGWGHYGIRDVKWAVFVTLVVTALTLIASVTIAVGTGRQIRVLFRRHGWLLQIGLVSILTTSLAWWFWVSGMAHIGRARPTEVMDGASKLLRGKDFTIAKSDGSVWEYARWWDAEHKSGPLWKLDRPPEIPFPEDVSPFEGLGKVKAVARGYGFLLALLENGEVWGVEIHESRYPHGPSSPMGPLIPLQEPGNVKAIATGPTLSLALDEDGRVWEWGRFHSTRSGPRTDDPPKEVEGLGKVIAISVSDDYALAVKDDGTVWGWGENRFGLWGKWDFSIDEPRQIKRISDVVDVDARDWAVLFLKKDGTVWICADGDLTGLPQIGLCVAIPLFLVVVATVIIGIRSFIVLRRKKVR
jgi:hypothetical protein